MANQKLKRAPLQEVVFEVRWELPLDHSGNAFDPGFDKAYGLFAKAIQEDFPILKDLFPPNPTPPSPYTPLYQFWKAELVWPVIQIGRGVLTVADVEDSYIWDDYRSVIDKVLECWLNSYQLALSITSLRLQYIDAVDVEDGVISSLDYVAQNFQLELVNRFTLPGKPSGLFIGQVFDLPGGDVLHMQVQTARNNQTNKNALLWITDVERKTKAEKDFLLPWLDQAHTHTSNFFKNISTSEFYASFDQ